MIRSIILYISVFLSRACKRLVIPREQLEVFLENSLSNLADNYDHGGVIAFLLGPLEAGADGLDAEEIQTLLAGFPGFLELLEQKVLAQLLEVACLIRINIIGFGFPRFSWGRVWNRCSPAW